MTTRTDIQSRIQSDSQDADRRMVRQITLLSFAAFAASGAARITDPLLPQLADAFGVSPGTAARAVSTFALAYGCAQLLYGPLGDRFGKYRVICGAMLASMIGSLGTALAPDFHHLLVFRTLNGATAAAAVPLSMAWIADNVPYERRQPVLAYFLIGQIFGMIAGQLFGGFFADYTGWRGAFWFMLAAFTCVGSLLFLEIRRSPGVDAAAARTTSAQAGFLERFGAVLGSPWARIIIIGTCVEGACVFGGLAFVPTYLHERFGISLTLAGGLMASFGFGGLGYALFSRCFVSSLGERGLAIAGGLLSSAAYLIFIFMPHWLGAIPGGLCAGMGYYMLHNTFQINATQMTPAHRGTAVALFAALFFLGQSSGVSVNAMITDRFGFTPAFLLPALLLPSIGFVFSWLLARKAKTGRH